MKLCSDIHTLLHVISFVDWPKHVKFFFFFLPCKDPSTNWGLEVKPVPPKPAEASRNVSTTVAVEPVCWRIIKVLNLTISDMPH